MSAATDFPYSGGRWATWVAAMAEIDSLRAEVDRLENDIDGHQRALAITAEVDELADLKATDRSSMFTVGYCAAINHLRVAGETT